MDWIAYSGRQAPHHTWGRHYIITKNTLLYIIGMSSCWLWCSSFDSLRHDAIYLMMIFLTFTRSYPSHRLELLPVTHLGKVEEEELLMVHVQTRKTWLLTFPLHPLHVCFVRLPNSSVISDVLPQSGDATHLDQRELLNLTLSALTPDIISNLLVF